MVLIPAFKPDGALVQLVQNCLSLGLTRVILVDDGSGPDFSPVFAGAEALGAQVVRHEQNRGKGAALKTGIRAAMERCPGCGVVTADADGQHLPRDILAVARALEDKPAALVLGVRDFSGDKVPARSRLGNGITAGFFRLLTGVRCSDTQTGLRGIPAQLLPVALETAGERYEYEMNLLMDAAKSKREIVQLPIQTVYLNGNASSHFRVIRDSALIYQQPLKYIAVALSSFAVDLILFALLSALVFPPTVAGIFAATAIARCVSGLYNFRMNQVWSFRVKKRTMGQFWKYLILFFAAMAVSSGAVSLGRVLPLPLPLTKAIVDTVLFVVNYLIQRAWVFR